MKTMKTQRVRFLMAIAIFLVLIAFSPQSYAAVSIGIGVALPPPIVVQTPPAVVVLPGAPGVYVAPDVSVDLFFWNGWWWRPWEGHWYRSHYYDRGWAYYRSGVPGFYRHVDPGWRGYQRSHSWNGRPWHYKRIPHDRFMHGRENGRHGHHRH